ncbi:MAG: hypothetical protein AAGD35_15255 [Actinomycetota bacterium]
MTGEIDPDEWIIEPTTGASDGVSFASSEPEAVADGSEGPTYRWRNVPFLLWFALGIGVCFLLSGLTIGVLTFTGNYIPSDPGQRGAKAWILPALQLTAGGLITPSVAWWVRAAARRRAD